MRYVIVMQEAEFISHTDTLPIAIKAYVCFGIGTYPDYKDK